MANRRPIQVRHEQGCVARFLDWFNLSYKTEYKVISEPNPPEAIIQSRRTIRWVEVATVFWNDAYAQDLYSAVTPGEEHVPLPPGPFMNMDEQFANRFVNVLRKKLNKDSYQAVFEKHGPGFLVLSLQHPWLDATTLSFMREAYNQACPFQDLGYFRGIYFPRPDTNNQKFIRWHA